MDKPGCIYGKGVVLRHSIIGVHKVYKRPIGKGIIKLASLSSLQGWNKDSKVYHN